MATSSSLQLVSNRLGPIIFSLDEVAHSVFSPINLWYLDDVTIVGTPLTVAQDLEKNCSLPLFFSLLLSYHPARSSNTCPTRLHWQIRLGSKKIGIGGTSLTLMFRRNLKCYSLSGALKHTLNQHRLACFASASQPHSGTWLNVIPSLAFGTILDNKKKVPQRNYC